MPTHTVLVVLADAVNRRSAKSILQDGGYQTLEAGNGLEALSIALSHPRPIDLLVADAGLPGIGGATLIETFSRGFPATPATLLPSPLEAGSLLEVVRSLLPPKKQPEKCLQVAADRQRSA